MSNLTVDVLLVLVVICWFFSLRSAVAKSCGDLECDAFKPVCAVDDNEHQFFYSHCAMVMANCVTGANWKRDFYSHCNVYM